MVLLRVITVALAWAATVVSLPVDLAQKPLVSGDDEACKHIDMFTMEWFLSHTKPEYRQEIVGKALFYTAGAAEDARRLACGSSDRYVTIWQIWPTELYNDKSTPDNPLRCIHRDRASRERYYTSMSNAYARMARKSATVMHKTKDYLNPPMNGIWGKTELPALRDKTDVKEVMKISEDTALSTRWQLPNKGPQAAVSSAIEEIANIFRLARRPLSGLADSNLEACALWSSMKGSYLDQAM